MAVNMLAFMLIITFGGAAVMRIAVCDDDKECIDEAKALIEKWVALSGIVTEIVTFDNGDDLIAENRLEPIDIIFLDIVMPLLNGIDTAKEIRDFDERAKIIFLTSTSEFAVASYNVEASDYLLKPVDYEHISRALFKVTQELQKVKSSIVIHTNDGYKKVYINEIEYIEASRKRTNIYLISGTAIKSLDPLYYFEQILSDKVGFFKCHRSFIVNISNLDSLAQNEVITKTGKTLPVARKLQKYFKKEFIAFYFQNERGEGYFD